MTKGGPAGGGYSTVGDLIRFGDALFGNVLLDRNHTEMLTTGKVPVDDLPEGGRYCFGLVEQDINGHRIVGHSGNLSGIRATLKIFVDDGLSVAILSNVDRDQGAEELEYFIQEQIAGETAYTNALLKNSEMVRVAVLDGYEAAVRKFNLIRDGLQLSEAFLDGRGQQLLRRHQFEEAIELLRFNAFAFPNSGNACASLASGYMQAGDNEGAMEWFERALEIDPESENATSALKQLGVSR